MKFPTNQDDLISIFLEGLLVSAILLLGVVIVTETQVQHIDRYVDQDKDYHD